MAEVLVSVIILNCAAVKLKQSPGRRFIRACNLRISHFGVSNLNRAESWAFPQVIMHKFHFATQFHESEPPTHAPKKLIKICLNC